MRQRPAHYWGVVLAGGDGERLKPLTRIVAGDDRPKQFCALTDNGRSLLAQTRKRIEEIFGGDRTLYVLKQQHQPFYQVELGDADPSSLLVQPDNRGTLPAIICATARIARHDPDALVGFFPSDHYYSNEKKFVEGVTNAFAAAEADVDHIVLLGVRPKSPEPGYGYIEPDSAPVAGSDKRLHSVLRFFEKPSLQVAQRLVERGCVWNTFVMIGRATAFLKALNATVPEYFEPFTRLLDRTADFRESDVIASIYRHIPSADFSRIVLGGGKCKLRVFGLGDIGWCDLGEPHRVIEALSRNGIESRWHDAWRRRVRMAAATTSGGLG